MKIKLLCIFADDSIKKMGGNRGKMVAQAGHAFLHSYWDAEERFPELAKAYRESDKAFKITLRVPSVEDLQRLHEAYRERCGLALITDAAHTVFTEPTTTCLGMLIPDEWRDDDLMLPVFM